MDPWAMLHTDKLGVVRVATKDSQPRDGTSKVFLYQHLLFVLLLIDTSFCFFPSVLFFARIFFLGILQHQK